MKAVRWNPLKNQRLKQCRGVSFEELLGSRLISVRRHPDPGRPAQKIMLFEHQGYVWVVPYVESQTGIFLKTLYPSRYWTSRLKRGEI